ncbi:MAG TPA: TonB-dependent receptor, partial [Myxococcota bacterium]|nr:TonB-dependent receptor [Myxococcota bacterium]
NGGPGQPQGLSLRGAGAAQTLVLVDGLRVGSATVGTTSIENIPLELVERIEVVRGPLSSLYGSGALGGVVQVFTRGKAVPHLFASAAYGSERDRRAAAGITTVDGGTAMVLSLGARKVDAPSATTARAPFCHDADRDPYENVFANLRLSQRLWQGEDLALEAFASRGRAAFDGCGADDRNDQTLAGARLTSSASFTRDWKSRLAIGQGRDRLEIRGAFPNRFETRQDQASWINDFAVPGGSLVAGAEMLRQRVLTDPQRPAFSVTERDTYSGFAGLTQEWAGHRLEASWRHDDDDAFGERRTGSFAYGIEWPGIGRISATVARGFRAPTFFDLYGPESGFYQPNPLLRPERNRSRELSLRSAAGSRPDWKLTVFDNEIDDLIAFVAPTVANVDRARIRGMEAAARGQAWGVRWSAALTVQRPRDEATGRRLQGRAERFGSVRAERDFGPWTAGLSVHASGERFDAPGEDPGSRLAGYAVVDARLRRAIGRHWSIEISATNLADRRYETSLGYEGARRGILVGVRFEAF